MKYTVIFSEYFTRGSMHNSVTKYEHIVVPEDDSIVTVLEKLEIETTQVWFIFPGHLEEASLGQVSLGLARAERKNLVFPASGAGAKLLKQDASIRKRDYKSKKAVQEDWNADKDFIVADITDPHCGRYINKQDALKGGIKSVNIRYQKLTKVAVIKVNTDD